MRGLRIERGVEGIARTGVMRFEGWALMTKERAAATGRLVQMPERSPGSSRSAGDGLSQALIVPLARQKGGWLVLLHAEAQGLRTCAGRITR